MSKSFTMYAVATKNGKWWSPWHSTFAWTKSQSEQRYRAALPTDKSLDEDHNTKIIRVYVSTTPPGRKS